MVPVTSAITVTTAAVTTMSPLPELSSAMTTTSMAVERHTTKSRRNRRWITSKSSDPSCHLVQVAEKHRILAVDRLMACRRQLSTASVLSSGHNMTALFVTGMLIWNAPTT